MLQMFLLPPTQQFQISLLFQNKTTCVKTISENTLIRLAYKMDLVLKLETTVKEASITRSK